MSSGTPSFIAEHDFKLGGYSVASACPDAPFAFCLGGDNHEDNFKVWDIRQSASGRSQLSFLARNLTTSLMKDELSFSLQNSSRGGISRILLKSIRFKQLIQNFYER